MQMNVVMTCCCRHNVMLYTGFGIVGFSVVSCLVTLALAFTIAPGCEALHRQSRVVGLSMSYWVKMHG